MLTTEIYFSWMCAYCYLLTIDSVQVLSVCILMFAQLKYNDVMPSSNVTALLEY